MRTRRIYIALSFFGFLIACIALMSYGWSRAREIPGTGVFRSGQLSVRDLTKVIKKHGVKTVVNLRGHGGGESWYSAEVKTCRAYGVAHHTVTFAVDDWAPRPRVLQLVEILERADRPVLIHCRRGVDRTGLGASVAILTDGGSLAQAERQLTLAGGHLCRRKRCPQHVFLDAYRGFLVRHGKPSSAEVFESWVKNRYCPEAYNASLSTASIVPTRVAPGSMLSLEIRAVNRGSDAWVLSSGDSGVRLGIRVIGPFDAYPEDPDAACRRRSNQKMDLARSGIEHAIIEPGEARLFPVTFRAPNRPGLYLLQADMVQEHEHWFCEMGWPGLVWELWVTD